MKMRAMSWRSRGAGVVVGALPFVFALGMLLPLAAEARTPPRWVEPPPQPMPQGATFRCEVETEAPRSVQAAWEEYWECWMPEMEDWLDAHDAEASRLEEAWLAWENGREHDLRGRTEAARFLRRHPVSFRSTHPELSAAQVAAQEPNMSARPAEVRGAFERFFVDRQAARMYLTSTVEGLVSLDISERYAFELLGSMGEAGAREFFILDERTAVVEEEPRPGANRDLVVLDIRNPRNPREIRRLEGVLPSVQGGATHLRAGFSRQVPTFDQYVAMRRGLLTVQACGATPVVSTHRDLRCRPDGSCYREVWTQDPSEGTCERAQAPVAARPVRQARPMPMEEMQLERMEMRTTGGSMDMAESGSMGRGAPVPTAAPLRSRRTAPSAPRAAMEAEAMPEGGAGGAGSLSQMMVHGHHLYVLSAHHARSEGWLTTFDIRRPREPRLRHIIALDNGPEALQVHDSLLLVAGRDALVTVSLGAPNAPRLVGEYRQNCPVNFDPVVVEGTIAYRTIIVDQPRSMCTSRLEVIDLSQPHEPMLRTTVPIARPRGLGVLGERLFVADEQHGIRVFDLGDPLRPSEVTLWPMRGVADLILSGFDLHAMGRTEIQSFSVAALYERGADVRAAARGISGHKTVTRQAESSSSRF